MIIFDTPIYHNNPKHGCNVIAMSTTYGHDGGFAELAAFAKAVNARPNACKERGDPVNEILQLHGKDAALLKRAGGYCVAPTEFAKVFKRKKERRLAILAEQEQPTEQNNKES